MAMKMGDYFVSIGVLTVEQVNEVIRMQKEGDARKFGDIAVSKGFINDSSIKKFDDYISAS
jgi:hypothetical protein